MKTMATQLSLLLRTGQRRSNARLLIKFMLVLIGTARSEKSFMKKYPVSE